MDRYILIKKQCVSKNQVDQIIERGEINRKQINNCVTNNYIPDFQLHQKS